MTPLKILTLNVKGMATPSRRALIFRFLRNIQAHVICLQEVHAPADCTFWSTQWGGAASWNNHTAILIHPSLGHATFSVSHRNRVLASTFCFQGQDYTIANIYAPPSETLRNRFFNDLSQDVSLFSTYDFLVGD